MPFWLSVLLLLFIFLLSIHTQNGFDILLCNQVFFHIIPDLTVLCIRFFLFTKNLCILCVQIGNFRYLRHTQL